MSRELHISRVADINNYVADQRLEVDFGIWGTVKKTAMGVVAFAIMCGLAAWYIPILRQSTELQRQIDLTRQALAQQKELQQKYLEEISAFRTTPEAVERAAREKMGLVKPNEFIYRFESDKASRR